MISKFGLFTPYTLRFFSDYYNEDSSTLLKRSLVLFDQMTYISREKNNSDFIKNIVSSESTKNKTEILKYFVPATDFVSKEWITTNSFTVNPESNMYYGPNSNEFLKFIKDFITKRFGFDAYNVIKREEFEILDFYVSALSADFDFLFQLSKKNSEISALYTELHRDAYFATYENKTNLSERVLNKVCTLNLIDFGKLTWEQIIELKNSQFINDFRIKLFEWINEYNATDDESSFENSVEKYIKESNFKFLSQNTPKLGSNITTGILGNLPSPIIVNPVSIYSFIKQIKKDVQTKKDFGWLFFIQEVYSKSKH